jgi:hypothetical protein
LAWAVSLAWALAQSTVSPGWQGLTTGACPPDPHGAAGPSGIIATANLSIQYFTKAGDGTSLWGPISLQAFWSNAGNTGQGLSDPKATYDPVSGHFYVIMQENIANPILQSYLNIAVSKTSDPRSSTAADWYFQRFDITQYLASTSGLVTYGADYPGLGYDTQAVYVTYNMARMPFTSEESWEFEIILIFNKASINNGNIPTSPTTIVNYDAVGNLQPATVAGPTSPGNQAYFARMYNSSTIRLYTLTDPLGTPSLSHHDISVPDNGGNPSPATQQNTSIRVDTLDGKLQGNATYFKGWIWACITAGGDADPSQIYIYQFTPNGNVVYSTRLGAPNGVWYYQPAVGINRSGQACVVFTSSSASTFPTIMYTVQKPDGTFETPTAVKPSANFINSCANLNNNVSRWGDYAVVSPDPTDDSFWICHEWAQANNTSSTWWARVVTPPPVIYVDSAATPCNHCPPGSCYYQDGSTACPYFSVLEAYAAADDFDIIRIAPGTTGHYPGALSIMTPLRLEALNSPVTIGR